MSLEALLVARIRREGPLTFRDFMAQALYHPEHGYYTTGRPWEGRGDFATAPMYSEAFALGVARFLAKARDALGPGPFEAVEVGAGSGDLAVQLAKLLGGTGVRLRAVEPRRPPRLPADVPWSASVEGLRVRGCILSNELFDALPVHRVARAPQGLREWYVAERAGRLAPELGPLSRPELEAYVDRFGWRLEEGQTIEVGLDALAMLRALARALEEGVLLTIDYGMAAAELPLHARLGTLAAYHEHRLSPDPLARPGEQDLTAHVNFTALDEEGRALGLATVAQVPQWQFLAALGALDALAEPARDAEALARSLAAKTLVAPGRMGDFRVLVQARGLRAEAAARLARALEAPA